MDSDYKLFDPKDQEKKKMKKRKRKKTIHQAIINL